MRDYGKVYTKFWESEDIRGLSDAGRLLALYLMTSPHGTIAGVFRLPDGYVCEDMKWTPEMVSLAFAELLGKGFANRCETTKWVWVTKHLEWNPPENPNQRKSAAKVAQSVPNECSWKLDFMRVCGPSLGIDPPKSANPSATVAQPFPNQEQEQDQEQKQEHSVPKGTGGKPPKLTDPKEIIFGYGLALLVNAGTPEKQARSFLGGLEKHHGADAVIDKLRDCAKAKPLQPLEWLAAALPPNGRKDVASTTTPTPPSAFDALKKIKEDDAKTKPPSLETLARMAELRKPKEIHA
jgi:hypothetical protein